MSEYDKGFQRGQQESIYNGNGSYADWAGWQQGHMIKERNEAALREKMSADTSSKPDYSKLVAGGGGGISGLIIVALIVFFAEAWQYLALTLELGISLIIASAIAVPVLRLVARALGVDYALGFMRGFTVLLKALGAYVLSFSCLFALFGFLGTIAPGSFVGSFTEVGHAVMNFLRVPAYAFRHVSWLDLIGTAGFLQIPSLAAFSYILSKNTPLYTKDVRGLWRGMVTGLGMVIVCGGSAFAFVHSLLGMM